MKHSRYSGSSQSGSRLEVTGSSSSRLGSDSSQLLLAQQQRLDSMTAAAAAGQQDVMTAGGGAGINQLLLQALTRQSQAQARTSSHHTTGETSLVSQNSSDLMI